MAGRKVTFTGAHGGKLAATLEEPQGGGACGVALFAHCFTCTKDIFSARYLTKGLVQSGFAVLRFDFTGLGASEGEFENTNFSSNVQDLLCAADYLRRTREAPTLLVGHSLGGAAVLAAAADIPEARAVATVAAPAEPAHIQHLFTDNLADIEAHGEAEVQIAGRPFRIKEQFLRDIAQTNLADKIANLGKALIIFHSAADEIVGIENARKIYETAQHPKSFISLDHADHLLSDKRDGLYISGVLAAWAQRYHSLPAPCGRVPSAARRAGSAAQPPRAVLPCSEADEEAQNTVVVESIGDHLAHTITNGKHELVADEPSSMGGGNTGPAPYGYLLAALGACTAITLRMYAKMKKLPLKKVTVHLQHAKSTDSNGTGGGADVITRTLKIEGDLTQAQRERMLAIANKCPVHRTLTHSVHIDTTLHNAAEGM